MAITLNTEGQAFSKKLEAFSGTLSDHERSVFRAMLQRPELADRDLEQVQGGAIGASALKLNSSFFSAHIALCW
jgi:hypothetical protein